MVHRRRNGGRRMSLKKTMLFLVAFSSLYRGVSGNSTAVKIQPPRNSGVKNLGNQGDGAPLNVWAPQKPASYWNRFKRVGQTAGKAANTAQTVAGAALNATASAATGAANLAKGAANIAGAAQQAAETLKEKAPEVATVTIDTAIGVATALKWLAKYGTAIFLYACFAAFCAEDTLLLLENVAVLNRLTTAGRERAELIRNRARLWELRMRSLTNKGINRNAVGGFIEEAQQLIKDHDEARRLYRQSRTTKASKLAGAVGTTFHVVTGGLFPLRIRRKNRSPNTGTRPRSAPRRTNVGTSPRSAPRRTNAGTSPRSAPRRTNAGTSPQRKSPSPNKNNMGLRRLFKQA